MKRVKFIIICVILSHSLMSQGLDEYKENTKPTSIKVTRINTETLEPSDRYENYSFYYSKKEELDSIIRKDEDGLFFKKSYYRNDTSRHEIFEKYKKGKVSERRATYFDESDFIYKKLKQNNLGSKNEYFDNVLNKKNENGMKQYELRSSNMFTNNKESSTLFEYFYFQDTILYKIVAYHNSNPVDKLTNTNLTFETINQFVPDSVTEGEVELKNDTIFIEYKKDEKVYLTEKCYTKKDYKFCEVIYQPVRENFKMIEREIVTPDSTIQSTINFKFQDSVFVKDTKTDLVTYKDSWKSHVYNYEDNTYTRKEAAIFTYVYDSKGNWIRRELRKNEVLHGIYTREISYLNP